MQATGAQVVEFIRALALGWKNLAAYPPGHPVLISSLDLIHRRLSELQGPGGEISLGIVRDGLLYGQEKVDSAYAQKFGNALYTRGVAILQFDPDTNVQAIETFLRMLGGSGDDGRPIWEELTAAGVMSIHLTPVDYSEVQISDDLDAERPKTDAEQLWEQILRAIVAGRELSAEGKALLSKRVHSASELAAMILQYVHMIEQPTEFDPDATFGVKFTYRIDGGDAAEDVGVRLGDAICGFITASVGARRDVAVKQAIELLKTLPDTMRAAVVRSVMRALAGDESGGALMRDFVENLENDEVLDSLRYLSSMMALSTHAIRLLETLMRTAKAAVPANAETSKDLVGDLVNLFGEEDIDRFNPDDHRQLLDQVSIRVHDARSSLVRPMADLGDRLQTITPHALSRQLAQTLMSLIRIQGQRKPPWNVLQRLEALFQSDIRDERFTQALEIGRDLQEIAITATNPALQDALHDTFDRLGSPETIRHLIDTMHTNVDQASSIEGLLEILGTAATKNLLSMLAEENNRSRRRRLFDFVAKLGTISLPQIRPYLNDSRWYVLRNMIALVRVINDRSLLPDIRRCANHPDLRVRLEAIRTLIALEPTPPRGLLEDAIRDPDPKIAEKAITLVGSYGIKEAVDPLLQLVDGNDVWGMRRTLRLRALRALGELAEPSALPRLQRFFTDSFLPWPSKEERYAAYESLAGYPANARASIVEKGMKSRDPYIREVCERMATP